MQHPHLVSHTETHLFLSESLDLSVLLWCVQVCLRVTLQPMNDNYTARNAQVAASLLLPSRYQDAFASLAPA